MSPGQWNCFAEAACLLFEKVMCLASGVFPLRERFYVEAMTYPFASVSFTSLS